MQDLFKDIFNYHHHYNQLLAEYFNKNSVKISEKSLQLFSHCINAHQIWNARILQHEPVGVHQMNNITENKRMNEENMKNTTIILNEKPLQEIVAYRNSKGASFSNTIQEILFHIANHFTHHRAQIMTDLRQCGLEPLVTDYIFYKRNN